MTLSAFARDLVGSDGEIIIEADVAPTDRDVPYSGSSDVSQHERSARLSISVLMATYAGEKAPHLARALESIYRQTIPPNQMVLVIDGPVPSDQEAVIKRYHNDRRIRSVSIVRLPENRGLGDALNAGFEHCQGGWIMRMDSDDEALPDRVAVQTDYIARYPYVDVVGGWSEEFFDDSPKLRIKSSPVSHEAIVQALRWRNVLVHPSLLLRSSTLRSVGGYRGTYPLLEDWDLYIRLILSQARFAVIPKVVVRMLVGQDQARRRGGMRYLYHEVRFRTFLWRSGLVGATQYAYSTLVYAVFRMVGPALRNWLYHAVRSGG